ncbi:MAG: hypothetical protein QM756_20470 [Polyangiaceae bacterium]
MHRRARGRTAAADQARGGARGAGFQEWMSPSSGGPVENGPEGRTIAQGGGPGRWHERNHGTQGGQLRRNHLPLAAIGALDIKRDLIGRRRERRAIGLAQRGRRGRGRLQADDRHDQHRPEAEQAQR